MFFPILLQDYLALAALRFPNKIALISGDERWTYDAIDKYTDQLACELINIGLKRQDRVVVFLDNSVETVISLYGILKAGGIFVILNGSMKSQKLSYVLQDSGARILISHTSKAKVVDDAINRLKIKCKIIWNGHPSEIPKTLASVSISWDSIFSNISISDQYFVNKKFIEKHSRCIDVDLAALIYTSGSTGEPKGVMSTHHNMITAARSIIQYLENTEDDIILNVLPLSFDYGLYQVLMSFLFGGTVVLEKSFVYIHSILERISQENVTGFPIVPTILAMILKLQNLDKYNLNSLRYISNTGAALPVEHIQKFRNLFPGVKLYSMFGLTECKRVGYLPPEELDNRPASVGKAMPNCETFIFDENGKEVMPGEVGELVIRGSNVMQGYWNAPELTAQYFRAGHYPGERLLHTGDFFRKDEQGFLYFIGRKDDMIKCKGERISAKEIENIIYQINGVIEVAVVGVPDEIFGQAIKAVIVNDPKVLFSEKEVLKHCATHLEPFAIPKYIEFVEELPKTPNGKIDKKILKTNG